MPATRSVRFRDALREAMTEEMERDDRVFLMGEEVGHYQGAYKVSEGMLEKFGPKRVIDTPIAEGGFAGIGVGAAMVGLRPIIEFMTWNFSAVAFDQILNNAAKVRQMSGGQLTCPIVFRGPNASARQVGSQHSHAMEHFYAHVPGLKVVAPAFPADAKGLLKAAIRDENPVLVMESETLYSVKGDIPEGLDTVPLGQAQVVRTGTDVTIVAYSRMTHIAIEAAAAPREGGGERRGRRPSLAPPARRGHDRRTRSERRTAASSCTRGGRTAGSGRRSAIACSGSRSTALDAPILRVTTFDVPMPYNAKLEQLCMPQADRVVTAVKRLMARGQG